MSRISNIFLASLNIFSILVSLLMVGFSSYVGVMGTSECDKSFYTPVLVLGLFIFVVSIMGLAGSCCRVTALLWIYLVVMFLLILCLLAFTVFALIVTNKGAGKVISGRGFKEYRLGNYSNWLQRRVTEERNWEKIKSCLIEVKVCKHLGGNADAFYKKSSTPVQSGCCKPPSACGFKNKNATYWVIPESSPSSSSTIDDCKIWSNDQQVLCYNCESCQDGVLDTLKKEWRKIAIVNAVVLLAFVLVYSIGCCAFRSNRHDNSSYVKYGP